MKTYLKVLIAAVVGLLIMWICYQLLHLDQVMTTVIAIMFTLATVSVCDKLSGKKNK